MLKQNLLYLCLPLVLASALGCNGPENAPVKAILRINRDGFSGSSDDFMIYRETQASLLQSHLVVQSALRDPDVQGIKDVNSHSVANSIKVKLPSNSEVMMVELHHPHLDREQSEKVLNCILDAYLGEIVAKERIEKVDLLTKLRSRHRQLFDKVQVKSDELDVLARELGSLDDAQVRILQSIKIANLSHLQTMLTKRELKRIQWQELGEKTKQEIAQAQIEWLKEQYESALEEVQRFGGTSGDLAARKGDLEALHADVQAVRSDMRKLELELEQPKRVAIIQRAQ